MTLDDFIRKWNRVPDGPVLRDLIIRAAHESGWDELPDNDRLRLEAECAANIGVFASLRGAVISDELRDQSADTLLAKLLDDLDSQLTERRSSLEQLLRGYRKPHRPVLVIVLGAGFSAPFGIPTTNGLTPHLRAVCTDFPGHLWEMFNPMYRAAFQDYPLCDFGAGANSFPNVEHLLAIWEGVRQQWDESPRDHDKHIQYEGFIQNLCAHMFCWSEFAEQSITTRGLFTELADWLRRAHDHFDVRFVTFNYDLIVERLCRRAGLEYEYISAAASSPAPIAVRKLHGSANWYEYEDIGDATPIGIPVVELGSSNIYATRDPRVKISDWQGKLPVIIPPIASKKYKGHYECAWAFAAADILHADRVLIVGYSFPPIDVVARIHLHDTLKKACPSGKAV